MKLYPMVMGTPQPIGTVRVTLLGARHLPSGDWSILGGGQDDNYFRIGLGDHKWNVKASRVGEMCEFMVFDPEVRLHIDLWDEDHLSEDDHLGHLEGMYLFQAVQNSEKPLQLYSPGSTTEKAGTVVLKISYFEGINFSPGTVGCFVMVSIREIKLPPSMIGRRIAIRAKLGDEEHTSPTCRELTDGDHIKLVASLMEDMHQRLKAQGFDEDSIKKLTDVEGLKCMPTKVDMACNHCMMFSIDSRQLDDGEISLTLLEWTETNRRSESNVSQTASLSLSASLSDNFKGPMLPTLEESTLSASSIQLSNLKQTQNHVLPGPITMLANDGSGTTFTAEVSVALFGLHPTEPPVVHIDRSSKRRRSAWNTWDDKKGNSCSMLCSPNLP
jgi:hypothetical protein